MVMVFGDSLRRKRTAVATYAIAAGCTIVSVITWGIWSQNGQINRSLAFVPLRFSLHPAASAYTLLTAEFLHLDPVHLIGNLVFLFAFGRSIENLLGPMVFAGSFIGLGALAFLGSWLLSPSSSVAIVGASGALSFLIGTYTVIFPHAKLRILPFLRMPYLPAWLFAVLWLASQIWSVISVGEMISGVAYATHLGGFVIGVVAGVTWKEFSLDTDRLIAELNDDTTS